MRGSLGPINGSVGINREIVQGVQVPAPHTFYSADRPTRTAASCNPGHDTVGRWHRHGHTRMSGPKGHPAAAQLQRPASSPSTNHPPQLVTRLLWICSPSSVKCCTTCPGRVAKAVRDCSRGPVRGTSTPSETQPTWMRLPGRLAELSFTNVYLLLTVLSIEISGGVTLSSSVRLSYGRGVGRGRVDRRLEGTATPP